MQNDIKTTSRNAIPNEVKLTTEFIEEIGGKQIFTQLLADHFFTLYEKTNLERYLVQAERVESCGKGWFFDSYRKNRIFDLKSISYCKNKFCPICQKFFQLTRIQRFMPRIEQAAELYDIYTITLTLPNCKGKDLGKTFKRVSKGFKTLVGYFNDHPHIEGIDFEQYGYQSAFRSIENLYSQDEYHVHLHGLFVLAKGLDLPHYIVNKYSISANEPGVVRKFSDLEILIQKIWFLLMNGKRVTKKAIDSTQLGYSCTFEKVRTAPKKTTTVEYGVDEQTGKPIIELNTRFLRDQDGNIIQEPKYGEAFKYATKTISEDGEFMSFKQFRTIYNATHGFRMIQGYGKYFYNIGKDEIDEGFAKQWDSLIEKLQSTEKAVRTSFHIDKLRGSLNSHSSTFICRKALHKIWLDLKAEGTELTPDMITLELLHDTAKERSLVKSSLKRKINQANSSAEFHRMLQTKAIVQELKEIDKQTEKELDNITAKKYGAEKAMAMRQKITKTAVAKRQEVYDKIQTLIKDGFSVVQGEIMKNPALAPSEELDTMPIKSLLGRSRELTPETKHSVNQSFFDSLRRKMEEAGKRSDIIAKVVPKGAKIQANYLRLFDYPNTYKRSYMTTDYIKSLIRSFYRKKGLTTKIQIYIALAEACQASTEVQNNFLEVYDYYKLLVPIVFDQMQIDFRPLITCTPTDYPEFMSQILEKDIALLDEIF